MNSSQKRNLISRLYKKDQHNCHVMSFSQKKKKGTHARVI